MLLELGGQFSTQRYRCRPLKCQAEANSFPPPAGHTLPPSAAHHTVHFAWDKQNCEFTLLLVTAGPFHHCSYSFGSLLHAYREVWHVYLTTSRWVVTSRWELRRQDKNVEWLPCEFYSTPQAALSYQYQGARIHPWISSVFPEVLLDRCLILSCTAFNERFKWKAIGLQLNCFLNVICDHLNLLLNLVTRMLRDPWLKGRDTFKSIYVSQSISPHVGAIWLQAHVGPAGQSGSLGLGHSSWMASFQENETSWCLGKFMPFLLLLTIVF